MTQLQKGMDDPDGMVLLTIRSPGRDDVLFNVTPSTGIWKVMIAVKGLLDLKNSQTRFMLKDRDLSYHSHETIQDLCIASGDVVKFGLVSDDVSVDVEKEQGEFEILIKPDEEDWSFACVDTDSDNSEMRFLVTRNTNFGKVRSAYLEHAKICKYHDLWRLRLGIKDKELAPNEDRTIAELGLAYGGIVHACLTRGGREPDAEVDSDEESDRGERGDVRLH